MKRMNTLSDNRKTNAGFAFLTGLGVGAVIYFVAEALVPRQVASSGDHDILLANRLGDWQALCDFNRL